MRHVLALEMHAVRFSQSAQSCFVRLVSQIGMQCRRIDSIREVHGGCSAFVLRVKYIFECAPPRPTVSLLREAKTVQNSLF